MNQERNLRSPPPAVGPGITWIDEFLATSRRKLILSELQFAHWQPSEVATRDAHGHDDVQLSHRRVSESTDETWFTPELRRCLQLIDKQVEKWVPFFRARREPWQATRYRAGGRYEYHFDAGHWSQERAGERERTVLLYLNTPRAGGGTHFGVLDINVAARAGRLLTWNNLGADRRVDIDMLHAGLPLRQGSKTVLITWVRQKSFKRRAK